MPLAALCPGDSTVEPRLPTTQAPAAPLPRRPRAPKPTSRTSLLADGIDVRLQGAEHGRREAVVVSRPPLGTDGLALGPLPLLLAAVDLFAQPFGRVQRPAL